MDKKVTAAIAAIDETAWQTIKYPNAVWEDEPAAPGGGYWVSDAQVAETDYVAFTETDERHRDHAVVEQVIAELKDGPLAHLPSGKPGSGRPAGRLRADGA